MALFKRSKPEEQPAPDSVPAPMSGPSPLSPRAEAPAPRAPDTGVGVPPRPAPSKENPPMSRPPYPSAPSPAAQASAAQAARQAPQGRQAPERRTLVVGRGISLQGTVSDAERLVVEGLVEASMIHAAELVVAPGGIFRGEAQVDEAEIAGAIDGTLTVRGNLTIRAAGKVMGTARCRRLQVEDGGQISGQMEMISDAQVAALPTAPDTSA